MLWNRFQIKTFHAKNAKHSPFFICWMIRRFSKKFLGAFSSAALPWRSKSRSEHDNSPVSITHSSKSYREVDSFVLLVCATSEICVVGKWLHLCVVSTCFRDRWETFLQRCDVGSTGLHLYMLVSTYVWCVRMSQIYTCICTGTNFSPAPLKCISLQFSKSNKLSGSFFIWNAAALHCTEWKMDLTRRRVSPQQTLILSVSQSGSNWGHIWQSRLPDL